MEISVDKFLDGKIKIYQPKKGYRAGIDAVLLASSIKTFKGSKILDIGSGAGTISFCIGYRCKDVHIEGIEKNIMYYLLAIKSLEINKLKSEIKFINKDFKDINNMQRDIIVSNPPWFAINSTFKSNNQLLNDAKIESLDLNIWIQKVFNNLSLTGEYYTIFPFNRVKKLVAILREYFGIIKIYPISSFEDQPPYKAIVYARKSKNEYVCTELQRIIIHNDDKTFKDDINGILKKGNSLSLA